MAVPPFVRRAVARVVAGGAIAAVLVALGGAALERYRFGADDEAARLRIETDVQAQFARLSRQLDQVARPLGSMAGLVRAAAAGDAPSLRALFQSAAASQGDATFPRLAVTVYGVDGRPLAWAGRSASIPADRLNGPAAVFLAPSSLGLRLVRVEPILDAGEARAGTVVAEATLPRESGQPAADMGFVLETSVVPVHLRPRFEGAVDAASPALQLKTDDGEPLAAVEISLAAIEAERELSGRRVVATQFLVLTVVLLLLTGPLLDWRRVQHAAPPYAVMTIGVVALIVAARGTVALAIDRAAIPAPALSLGASDLPLAAAFLGNPFHMLATALTLAALTALTGATIEHGRASRRRRRVLGAAAGPRLMFTAVHVAAGALVAWGLVAYESTLHAHLSGIPVDVLHVSLHPFEVNRLAVVTALLVTHASAVALSVMLLQAASLSWIVRREDHIMRLLAVTAWLAPWLVVLAKSGIPAGLETFYPGSITLPLAVVGAVLAARWRAPLRHASQAARLGVLFLLMALPALALYPTLLAAGESARHERIETRYAPEVVNQRRNLQLRLTEALDEIDAIPGLSGLVTTPDAAVVGTTPTDAAYLLWSQTSLAEQRLTSSVELYDAGGTLVSRFALKLPEAAGAQAWTEGACGWEIFEEVSPFFAEERRLLHAGRAVCVDGPDGRQQRVGSVVVHVMLDYSNLSFVSAQAPYVALLRAPGEAAPDTAHGGVEFAVYGWSRRALYASAGEAWPLTEEVFTRAYGPEREPFWASVERGGDVHDVYYLSDRGAIYALGYQRSSMFGHLVTLAELLTLAGVVFILMMLGGMLYGFAAMRTPASGRALLREVRASFYRKLFLAFVLASVVPVLSLAFVTRAYIATLMREDVEMEATRTAASASRVVEDFGSLQDRGASASQVVDDNLVVWLSRVIAQDVNIFEGSSLLASSERNLFASGLLPTRTPGDVYRALMLEGRPTFVGEERVGAYQYLVAAAPVRVQNREAILTVPLTLRQQEIEAQVDELDRRILLAALLFIMMGAAIGYSMAERIADPVSRLTRATRQIARGELDARILATSSDEFRRLVDAFNTMAADLERQRGELERTNRLAAWADMARQVAHDIKNPLTPIQLNAEHLRRVHVDRGQPMGAVIDECVGNILLQVRLLRQIAAEFSSFASSPQPRPAVESLAELVREVVEPYRTGLAGRVTIDAAVPHDVPAVFVDRTLVGRALTNVIENALHAMPGGGTLRVSANLDGPMVRLDVTDSGVGMDAAALAKIFEPYFSTKAAGTGLGLTIAKRNIELNGGRIDVRSRKGDGTTVSLWVPVATAPR